MRIPTLLSLGWATTFVSLSTAHTVLTTIFIDGKNQGDGTCIRMGLNPDRTTFPISSLDSPDMACGLNGETPVSFTCPAKAGSDITFAFRSWADDPSRGPIDKSHVGSISIYLKHLGSSSSSSSASAAGGGWFKIFQSGYSKSTKKWSAETLIDNHGLLTASLPSAIPSGNYLIRTEILALQNFPETQFFVNCAQLYVSSSSSSSSSSNSAIPSSKTVSIPGHVSGSDPGLKYNIYETDPDVKPYPIVGPKVYFPTAVGTSSSSSSTSSFSSETEAQTSGQIPAGCILKNANWCATELPDFSSETTCWLASDDCWRQVEECYAAAPPSGNRGCKIWSERKCESTQRQCSSGGGGGGGGDWTGPKNKGAKVAEEEEISQPVPGGGKLPGVDKGEGRDDDDETGEEEKEGGEEQGGKAVVNSSTFTTSTAAAAATAVTATATADATKAVATSASASASAADTTLKVVVTSAAATAEETTTVNGTKTTTATVTVTASRTKGKTHDHATSVKPLPGGYETPTSTPKSGGGGCRGGRQRRRVAVVMN